MGLITRWRYISAPLNFSMKKFGITKDQTQDFGREARMRSTVLCSPKKSFSKFFLGYFCSIFSIMIWLFWHFRQNLVNMLLLFLSSKYLSRFYCCFWSSKRQLMYSCIYFPLVDCFLRNLRLETEAALCN